MGGSNDPRPRRVSVRALAVGLCAVLGGLVVATTQLVDDQPARQVSYTPSTVSRWSSPAWSEAVSARSATNTSTSTSTSTSTTTTTEPVTAGPASITLAFGGDVLPHMPLNDRAASYGAETGVPYDYAPMFAPLEPVLAEADVAICHMEVPLAPPGERITSYPSFGAPPELVEGIASAGYDGCTTASNHSLDRGRAGLDHLLDRFDAAGLLHNGTARVAAEGGGTATTYEVDGVRIANLSYAYDFNGYRIPADAPWSVNQIDPDAIAVAAERARNEGADLVVLSLHWGDEYVHEPSRYQRDVAAALLPSPDIDLIVGHHAHVVQPIEVVEGTPVVFGLGNQVSNQEQLPRRDGLTVRVRAEPSDEGTWSVTEIEAVPTYVELPSFRILPVVATLGDPAVSDHLRAELEASYDRTAAVLGVGGPLVRLEPRP